MLYTPWKGYRPEEVDVKHWGDHTSEIIALFLTEGDAKACLMAGQLRHWDERWQTRTDEVMNRIGSDHPVFIRTGYYHFSSAELRRKADYMQATYDH